MPPVFSPVSNLIARASVLVLALCLVTATALAFGFSGSAYDTGSPLGVWQPVPFSHAHHVGELRIDCRYCHTSVDRAAAAGMPSTDVCMQCHSQIWTEAEMLAPVRASWQEGVPLRWKRVYELPDYVYFEHAVHVRSGIECAVCHGDVDRMPLVFEAVEHTMQWCLDCHRDPTPRLGARRLLTAPPPLLDDPPGAGVRGGTLPSAPRTSGLTSCSTCHR